MSVKYVLFDLDGTLLPMDQDRFIEAYFGGIAAYMAPHGYDPKTLIGAIWKGTEAMIRNDGTLSNEEAFWKVFTGIFGPESINAEPILEVFYKTEFQKVQQVCGFDENAVKAVSAVKARGFRTALATNPIFPRIATESRIRWAGLEPELFDLITTYENSRYTKPTPEYYGDILDSLGAAAEQCVMVGNDVKEDMVAARLGMRVFLLTDCLINKKEEDISRYPHGGYPELLQFINSLT